MIEELKKTKASKLWFSMVVVFVVLLNVSFVEAKSLKKGEEFKEKSGGAIRVVSSDEVEIEQGPDILLGKYTIDGERVRIVINALGTAMVRYYKIIPDGLKEEKVGTIYYSKAGLAAFAALEEKRKRAEEEQRIRTKEEQRKATLAAEEKKARRFKDNGDGTVTDNETKLMWQQGENARVDNREFVIGICKGLSLAGYNDWHLPKVIDITNSKIDMTKFPNAENALYWAVGANNRLWSVGFDSQSAYNQSGNFVRCVRGGQ